MLTVWRVPLDTPQLLTARRLAWLSEEERARAARFRFPEHALRWQVAHVALRDLLGRATNTAPEAVTFSEDANGKPRLTAGGAPEFNLTHSGDIALVAIGAGAPLGVDVEVVRPVPELRGVVESHFAAEERAALWVHEEGELLNAFYRCWTRKEAYVKATGVGIGPALARFAVSLDPARARLLRADHDAGAVTEWSIVDLGLALPYIGALAVRDTAPDVRVLDWDPA